MRLLLLILALAAFAWAANSVDPVSIARGGTLYDKWWKVVGAEEPQQDHPLWVLQSSNTRSGGETWRCKECHGWDYKGADGAYASGSHSTGFPGILESIQRQNSEQIVAALSGATNADHDFSVVMSEADLNDLANFLKFGASDDAFIVDYSSKKPLFGDLTSGRAIFKVCAVCHGPDGTAINFKTAENPVFIGTLANDNPWEFLHKARSGQPGTTMPGMLGILTDQQFMDLLAYAQSLPE